MAGAGLRIVHRGGVFFKPLANYQFDKLAGGDVVSDGYLEGCYRLGMHYPDLCASIYVVCEQRRVKLGIMQPYLFPYLGYFQLMRAVDRFVVYDDVAFIKQGWINRNRILINGQPSYFTVPIKHASSFAPIHDTLIDDAGTARAVDREDAQDDRQRLPPCSAVRPRIPARRRGADEAARIVWRTWRWRASGRSPGSSRSPPSGSRVRRGTATRTSRAKSACSRSAAPRGPPITSTRPGGRELYGRDRFEAEGVRLHFLQPRPVEYRQFDHPFVPWLSIVDVLMFNPVETVRTFLGECDLT